MWMISIDISLRDFVYYTEVGGFIEAIKKIITVEISEIFK